MKIGTFKSAEFIGNSFKYFDTWLNRCTLVGKSQYRDRFITVRPIFCKYLHWKKWFCSCSLCINFWFLAHSVLLHYALFDAGKSDSAFFFRSSLFLLLLCEYLRRLECGWKLILDYILFTSQSAEKKKSTAFFCYGLHRTKEAKK